MPFDHDPGSYRRRGREAAASLGAVERLRSLLGNVAVVRPPNEAKEPILSKSIRLALYQWLTEIRSREELAAVKTKPRTKALLKGPPGTGKTTLAHHLAMRLGIPLVEIGAESLIDKYMGETEQRLGRIFDALVKAETDSILFVDELEVIGGSRDQNTRGGADNARTSILTVLLRRFEQYDGFAIGATNRPKDIDPALWRRFHIQMELGLPGVEERYAILKMYADPFDIHEDALDCLAELTEGASPALLEGLMNGMKRSLILNPKMRLPIEKPEHVFVPIISSLEPPPEIDSPALWRNPASIRSLDEFPWPPKVKEGE